MTKVMRNILFIVVLGVLISAALILSQVIFAEKQGSDEGKQAYSEIRDIKNGNNSGSSDSKSETTGGETLPDISSDQLKELLDKNVKQEKQKAADDAAAVDQTEPSVTEEVTAEAGDTSGTTAYGGDATIYQQEVSAAALGISLGSVDFAGLKAVNNDIVGWIYCEGTNIDYPVLHGTDNEYYLKHLYDGSYNNNGSVFLDMDNSTDFTDRNSVLYGHHMINGSMFANLVLYKDQSFYDTHPYAILYTPNANYLIQLFCGYVKGNEGLPTSFASDDEFIAFMQNGINQSTFASNVNVSASDRIITLSTCSYEFNDARYAVMGRLIRLV